MGVVRPSDIGVRGALVAHIVPADQLMGALGLSRTTSDVARIMGALTGAGLFAEFGIATAYVVVTSCYALSLLLVLAMGTGRAAARRDADSSRCAPPVPLGRSARGARLRVVVAAAARRHVAGVLVNATAFPLSGQLLPYVARDVYGLDQTGLGYLSASFAAGALLGSLAVSIRRTMQPARVMLLSSLAWYLCLLVFAQMQGLVGGALLLALAGFAQSFSMITLAVVLLRLAGERFRGRIMGVRMMAIYGLPVGLLSAGVLIERIGFSATATLYAVLGLACTLLIAAYWRAALWHAHATANAR